MKGVNVERDSEGRVVFVNVIDEESGSFPIPYRVDQYEQSGIRPDWHVLPDA